MKFSPRTPTRLEENVDDEVDEVDEVEVDPNASNWTPIEVRWRRIESGRVQSAVQRCVGRMSCVPSLLVVVEVELGDPEGEMPAGCWGENFSLSNELDLAVSF